jgi:hypothetical protein
MDNSSNGGGQQDYKSSAPEQKDARYIFGEYSANL